MSYALFIDDERDPPEDGKDWVVARSFLRALRIMVIEKGMPSHISFDHDLGPGMPTGKDIAQELVNLHLDGQIEFPEDFTFYVHSQNPVGAKNIQMALDGYLKHLENKT